MTANPQGGWMLSYGLAAVAFGLTAVMVIGLEIILLSDLARWHAVPAVGASLLLTAGLHRGARSPRTTAELLILSLLLAALFTALFFLLDARLFRGTVYISGWLIGGALVGSAVLAFLPVLIVRLMSRQKG